MKQENPAEEWLTLQISASKSFYGGNVIHINLLDSKILYFKLSQLIVPIQQDRVVQYLIQFVISLRYWAHSDLLT